MLLKVHLQYLQLHFSNVGIKLELLIIEKVSFKANDLYQKQFLILKFTLYYALE